MRGRQYPWGIVEVENPKHSDFIKLRTMLMVTHMHDLKDVTRDVHYENYRAHYITRAMRETADDDTANPGEQRPIDDVIALQQRQQQRLLMQQQQQQSVNPRMSIRTATKEKMLKQKDAEIARMQEMILQMQKQLTTTTTTTTDGTATSTTNASMTKNSSSSSLASQSGENYFC